MCIKNRVKWGRVIVGSRGLEVYFHTVDGSVTHQEIMASMNGFVRSRSPEKLTIVVMDNASVHRKAVEEAGWDLHRYLSKSVNVEGKIAE